MMEIVEFFKGIPTLIYNHKEFIMTCTTMVIGIFAGWFPTFKMKTQIICTVIVAFVFNLIVWFCYKTYAINVIAIIASLVWCGFSILFLNKKEEVNRRKIGQLIVDFTEEADTDKPICIFGGDLNFFGDYIPEYIKMSGNYTADKDKNKDIETNDQFSQIVRKGFREIKILAVKPYSETHKDKDTRIRIGYIVDKLGDRVELKFFDNHACNSCENLNECIACNCNHCMQKGVCNKYQQKCDKLEKYCQNSCYNPDVTLRGRIVTNKVTQSNCVAIATTKESGKKYILREYSAVAQECKLYQVIWEVWWAKCKADDAFVEKCKKEFAEYRDK